jgi:DNA-binding NtrC family response regulator
MHSCNAPCPNGRRIVGIQLATHREETMPRVLIVDDEADFAESTAQILRFHRHEVATAGTLGEARAAMAAFSPDILLLDLMLPDGIGLELLDELPGGPPQHMKVVLVTGHPAVKAHITSLTGPAVSYLTKPLDTRELLDLVRVLAAPDEIEAPSSLHFGLLVGESPPMQVLYQAIGRIAPTDCPVLISGATGTGKELVARAIHLASGRKGEFVAVNSGSLARDLAASELFGHQKGSFTGAIREHAGLFQRAHGGTLFLDELTDMPMHLQAHLMRVLETGRISPVGSEKDLHVDARVVAATNRVPEEAIADHALREDLYYRLSVFPIKLPELREKRADIPLLAAHFLREMSGRHGQRRWLSQRALDRLAAHDWPGNVRELRHVIHRAFILTDAHRREVDLPESLAVSVGAADAAEAGPRVGSSIRDLERELILRTLEHFGGDKRKAVEVLGISLNTLYNRLQAYGRM